MNVSDPPTSLSLDDSLVSSILAISPSSKVYPPRVPAMKAFGAFGEKLRMKCQLLALSQYYESKLKNRCRLGNPMNRPTGWLSWFCLLVAQADVAPGGTNAVGRRWMCLLFGSKSKAGH